MKQSHRRLVFHSLLWASLSICTTPVALSAQATTPGTTPNQPSTTTEPQENTTTPHGQVLYQSHGEPGSPQPESTATTPSSTPPSTAQPQLTDQDRAAVRITAYDLDIRITPASSSINGRARLTLTNSSDAPLPRIALQISSTLTWQSATLLGSKTQPAIPLPLAQHHLDTDADHTGQASEVILTLPTPLAPSATLTIDTFYAGTIQQSSGRLERIGASPAQAAATDWDAIAPDSTALRGFGNVLWYPVAAPQLFLSDGSLLPAIGRARLQHAATDIHLRLSIDYTGEPPVAAYFCGRRQPLKAFHDNSDAPVAFGGGVATVDFPAESIGFRTLSLFVISQPEILAAPLPKLDSTASKTISQPPASSISDNVSTLNDATPADQMLAVESNDDSLLAPLANSAEHVAPLLENWLGPHPLSALTVIDHPGHPFEDGPLLVAPLASLVQPTSASLLAHSLTHAWVQTDQPWMDEGLAEFFSLLWTEREKGRDAAIQQLDALLQPVVAAETAPSAQAESLPAPNSISSSATAQAASASGQPLIEASDEIFYRRKAAAVWWMLRDIAGEQSLQLALSAWRTQPTRHDSAEAQAQVFEALLEKISGKDLGWFFNDWVLCDRGLPNLSIVDVTPRLMPAGTGHDRGWLVAVTMRNQGEAAAEVPLIIRSGAFSITKRVRIPGLSNVTDREIVQTAPTEVVLNDGSVPETGPMEHTRTVVIHNE